MKKNFSKILSVVLVILWMSVIFMFSAQEAAESSKQSEGLIVTATRIVSKMFGVEHKIDNDSMYNIERFVRKSAHFFSYALLGILVVNCLSKFKVKKLAFVALAVCLLYAISDEIHQLFVPGRSGQVSDVVLDFCGSITGLLVFLLLRRLIGNRRKV